MQDKNGQTIKAGDFIVYGHAMGRCSGLRYGVVKAVAQSKPDWNDETKEHCRVRGADDDSYGGSNRPTFQLNSRDGTLQFGDRILVIDDSQMPARCQELLHAHYVEWVTK